MTKHEMLNMRHMYETLNDWLRQTGDKRKLPLHAMMCKCAWVLHQITRTKSYSTVQISSTGHIGIQLHHATNNTNLSKAFVIRYSPRNPISRTFSIPRSTRSNRLNEGQPLAHTSTSRTPPDSSETLKALRIRESC